MATTKDGYVKITPKHVATFKKLHRFVEKIALREKMLTEANVRRCVVTIDGLPGRTCASSQTQNYHLHHCFFGPTKENLIEDWMLDPRQARRTAVKSAVKVFRAAMMGGYAFNEYASFFHKPGIGPLISRDLNECFIALIAHEMSHTINQCARFRTKWYGDNHDAGFQNTYRHLRTLALAEYRDWKAGALERKAAAAKTGTVKAK